MNNNITTCLWCNQASTIIWVHGHGQCSICGTNIEECCRGENCFPAKDTDEVNANKYSNPEGIDPKNE